MTPQGSRRADRILAAPFEPVVPASAHAMEVVTPDECAVAIEMDPNLVSGVALGTPALIREGGSAGTSMVEAAPTRSGAGPPIPSIAAPALCSRRPLRACV